MDYACPALRSAARSHVWKLQVLQSKCFRLATDAPWYVNNRQMHEDIGVPLFADHIRALTETETEAQVSAPSLHFGLAWLGLRSNY